MTFNMKKKIDCPGGCGIKVLRKLLLGKENTKKDWRDMVKEPVTIPDVTVIKHIFKAEMSLRRCVNVCLYICMYICMYVWDLGLLWFW